jgi:hypothetical protein
MDKKELLEIIEDVADEPNPRFHCFLHPFAKFILESFTSFEDRLREGLKGRL